MTKPPHTLELVKNNRSENERLFRQLQARPEQFDQETFEVLFERFSDRLCFDERIGLLARRIERGPRAKCLEERAVLEMMVGDLDEAHRLRRRVERRDASGLQIVTSSRARAD